MKTKTLLRMTASELAVGRFMRGPDHTAADTEGDAGPPDGDDQTPVEEQLTTEQQLEKEFIQHDEDGEDGPDDDDDGEDDGESSADDDGDEGDDDSDEGDDESDGAESEADGEGKPSDEQSKADPELVARAEAAEREAARLKELAREKGVDLEASIGDEALPTEPNPEDYTYGEHDEKYIKDRAKYEAKMELIGEQATARFKAEAASLDAKWERNLAENKARYEDFDEVVAKGAKEGKWTASPVMAVAIKDSEHGVDLAYRLASNPEESARIAKLTPLEQARELGRLEATIGFEKKAAQDKASKDAKAKEARRISKAPPPPKRKVRGSGGRSTPNADTDDFAAFERMADEKLAKASVGLGR